MLNGGWNLWVGSKFLLFRCLEFLSGILNQNSADNICTILDSPLVDSGPADAPGRQYVWIFVSTIGELNAINPFIRMVADLEEGAGLVLLTDHDQYTQSYQRQYPEAYVVHHGDSARGISDLFDLYPPWMFLIAEIPCIYSDAPCRFSFRVIYELKRRNVPVIVVNGWLYEENTSCRMDEIEHRLFADDYLQAIDLYLVQTNSISHTLMQRGVGEHKIHVTGNIKFDVLALEQDWSMDRSISPEVLRNIQKSGRPCLVAGCVAEIEEALVILEAFKRTRDHFANALLILAPRHPENSERMECLTEHITDMDLRFIKKTDMKRSGVDGIDLVLLDTIGELRDFYAISTVSYVGMNHNILEPLMYNKDVVILPGWERSYPTYPVYEKLIEMAGITEVETFDGALLAEAFLQHLKQSDDSEEGLSLKEQLSEQLSGAAAKDIDLIRDYLETGCQQSTHGESARERA